VAVATDMLVNGDTVQAAAPVVAQSGYNAIVGGTASVNNVISWPHLLRWLVDRAKAGVPVDTVVGNWDSAFRWAMLWQLPVNTFPGGSGVENLQRVSQQVANLQIPLPKFAVSSAAPANKLIGFTKSDTLEELVEAGSTISESERSIRTQSVMYVKTENTGYRLVYGDTRSIFNYGA
jgi:hypothetical protein